MPNFEQTSTTRVPLKALNTGISNFHPTKVDSLCTPTTHEERLEWVKKSYERFFEKVRDYDELLGLRELN